MPDGVSTEPGLLTAQQVATQLELAGLKVGARTVGRWSKRGTFPAPIRIGNKLVRWRSADVQRYIEKLPAGKPEED